jgi:uncharacterized protein (TIRG00374 family)
VSEPRGEPQKKPQAGNWRRAVIGIAVSVLLLYLAFRGTDWSALGRSFKAASPWHWALAALAGVTNHLLRAMRWGVILAPVKRASWRSRVAAVMVSNFANNVLPLRLGELARAHVLTRTEGIETATALVSVVFERFIDILSVVVMLGLLAVLVPGNSWVGQIAWMLFGVSVVGLGTLLIAYRLRARIGRIVDKAKTQLEKSGGMAAKLRLLFFRALHDGAAGAAGAASPKGIGPITAYTIVMLVAGFASNLAPLLPYATNTSPWIPAYVAYGFVTVAAAIPSAPANVGPIQYACVLALKPYGLSREQALAYSFVYHGSQFVPLTLIGLVYSLMLSVSWRDVSKIEVLKSEEPDRD